MLESILPGQCPLCGKLNHCAMAEKPGVSENCWCENVVVPESLLAQLPEQLRNKSCICRQCINKYNTSISNDN